MGIHSKKGRKTKSRAVHNNNNITNNNNNNNISSTQPACVAKLYSQDWAIVEEGCADIAAFALHPIQHANLILHSVPQRLAELLLFTQTSMKREESTINNNNNNNNNNNKEQCGVFYLQTAAAEALRNLIVNSVEDAVVDALASAIFPFTNFQQQQQEKEKCSFRDGLVKLLLSTWETVQKSYQEAQVVNVEGNNSENNNNNNLNEGTNVNETDEMNSNNNNNNNNKSSSLFIAAARALEELLHLLVVCVEGSEYIAEVFSAPLIIRMFLSMLESTTAIVWNNLQNYENDNNNNNNSYKRREIDLMSAIAVAASEVLHVLSGDNELLSTFLQSQETIAPHQTFLNQAIDAISILSWLQEEKDNNNNLLDSEKENAILLQISRQNILYQMCEVSLHIQGTLINSAPNSINAARILPLIVNILNFYPPYSEWRRTVPLLLQECNLSEEIRTIYISRALYRLRCDQAAINVLHAVVDVICSYNNTEMEDELAFQANSEAKLLYNTNAMFVVGKLMKDALRLPTTNDNNNNNNNNNIIISDSIINQEDIVVEKALRAAAGNSGTGGIITKLQLLVLSNEVGVWSLANTLLLMIPWTGLGETPACIWRAIINAICTRAKLVSEANTNTLTNEEEFGNNNNNNNNNNSDVSVLTPPAAMHFLRLQLESLVQMLWTMQRKQTASNNNNNNITLQDLNQLQASPSDVDIITRLAWESHTSALQRQACVGVVCSICNSFKNTESITAATRFALAILQFNNNNNNNNNINTTSIPPSGEDNRRKWLAQFIQNDAIWRVRCEAANNIIDLFLDETYDESVYIPLRVHNTLKEFLNTFQLYIKQRQQTTREVRRNYKVVLPEIHDLEHWQEVLENLSGFLEYKIQQIGRQRLAA